MNSLYVSRIVIWRVAVILVVALFPCRSTSGLTATSAAELHKAVVSGDLAEINTLLNNGADPNEGIYGETPLMVAVQNQKSDVVRLLLDRGANPNIESENAPGRTALHVAFDFVEPRRSFLRYGLADTKNACHIAKINPIGTLQPWREQHAAIVRLLLNHGADPNTCVEYSTVLMWAALHGEIDLVRLLLRKGADVNMKFENGSPAIVWAAIGGHHNVVNLLKQQGGVTTLRIAAMIGDKQGVRRFLKAGADINGTNHCERTPLMEAAWGGSPGTIKVLLDNGADVRIRNANGTSAFMVAASRGNIDAAKLLLNNGANVNLANEYGRTPLMDAASDGNLKVGRLLLDYHADINARDAFDKTAFMRAVETGHVNVAKFLLANGANVDSFEEDGWTAAMTAANRRDLNMMKLLCRHGSTITLNIAAMIGDRAEVQRLLASGADINGTDAFGQTPLLWASAMGHEEIIKFLLDKGADVNYVDQNGWTALMWAARNSRTVTLRRLLENGAYIDATARDGWTALMWATRRGQADAVRLLTDRGADVNVASWCGVTALDMAHRNSEIVAILKSHGAKKKDRLRSKRGDQCGEEWDYQSVRVLTGAPAPRSSHKTVRMDSQEVIVRLGEFSFVVDAVFRFFNTGETTMEWVGFPKQGNPCRFGFLLDPAFIRFDTWIDGRKVEFSEEFSEDRGLLRWIRALFFETKPSQTHAEPHARINRYDRWLVKQVTFHGRSRTTIRLSCEGPYSTSGGPLPMEPNYCLAARANYIPGTASRWKNGDRKFAFTVDTSGVGGISRLHSSSSQPIRITENSVRYEAGNYELERKMKVIGASICW